MNKYRMRGACACVFAMLMLVGCGGSKVPETVNVTSLAVADDGTVTSYLVDVFDKEYYDLSDLTNMAVKEAADYNTENQEGEIVPITVVNVEKVADDSGKVIVTHKYDSADTYTDYNEGTLFYGTVADAVNAGYDMNAVMKSVKDGTLLTKEQLLQEPDRYLLITDENAVIYCPGKVTHISEGAVYKEDGSVDALNTEGMVVILMK